ncbi:hypothetical protein ILYODFUR_023495 [Ilyodon furcidens]|uniref:Uncharacterized protein n=1 Tax=Ilyodon furcidens TaxID=33524 RepID=A0ABV0TX20_9TELE
MTSDIYFGVLLNVEDLLCNPLRYSQQVMFLFVLLIGICSESSNISAPMAEANSTLAKAAGGATTVTIHSTTAQVTTKPTTAVTESMARTEAVATSVDTVNKAASSTQQTATTERNFPVPLSTALIATTTPLNSSAKISPAPASTSGRLTPQTTVIASSTMAVTMAKAVTQATVLTGTNIPVSDQPLLTKPTGSNGGFKASTVQPGQNGTEMITRNTEALTTVPSVEAMSKNTLTMSTARKEESIAGKACFSPQLPEAQHIKIIKNVFVHLDIVAFFFRLDKGHSLTSIFGTDFSIDLGLDFDWTNYCSILYCVCIIIVLLEGLKSFTDPNKFRNVLYLAPSIFLSTLIICTRKT